MAINANDITTIIIIISIMFKPGDGIFEQRMTNTQDKKNP